MGFRRGKTLHTALSGAEWARLTLALGCATFKADATVLAIFTPEERAFDPETLAAVMNALSNAPGQVILQSPHSPSNTYRPEWRVVDLEENIALLHDLALGEVNLDERAGDLGANGGGAAGLDRADRVERKRNDPALDFAGHHRGRAAAAPGGWFGVVGASRQSQKQAKS
jgi:hypothetical protein